MQGGSSVCKDKAGHVGPIFQAAPLPGGDTLQETPTCLATSSDGGRALPLAQKSFLILVALLGPETFRLIGLEITQAFQLLD